MKVIHSLLVLLLSLITPLVFHPLATSTAATSHFVGPESTIAPTTSGESTMAASAKRRRYRRGRYRGPVRASRTPIGASARCRDGTYSFSRNRRGTCCVALAVSQRG